MWGRSAVIVASQGRDAFYPLILSLDALFTLNLCRYLPFFPVVLGPLSLNMAHIADLMVKPITMNISNKYSSRDSSPHTTHDRVCIPTALIAVVELTIGRARLRTGPWLREKRKRHTFGECTNHHKQPDINYFRVHAKKSSPLRPQSAERVRNWIQHWLLQWQRWENLSRGLALRAFQG
jgi:hypothetical protein